MPPISIKRYVYAPLLGFELFLMVLYFFFVAYADKDKVKKGKIVGFQETHAMIFIGFAYLMTFLKRYCYSATGYNLLLAALVIQWSLLCQGFFHMVDGKIVTSPKLLLEADIMSATVLITYGALLGLASGTQLLFIAVVEALVGSVNLFISEAIFEISDIGGSICIHAYGAYFGLGVSAALRLMKPPPEALSAMSIRPKDMHSHTAAGRVISIRVSKQKLQIDTPSYTSDVTAMLGSLVLWIYWPWFNSALATTDVEQQRAIVNTYLSLAACTVVTFVLSAAVSHKPGKLDMVHIQNSSLAGGVGVGAVANMYIGPGGAIAIGIGAAFISVLGYRYLSPKLEKLGIQDTCGVNNLHGMPGIYSGLLSILVAGLANYDVYGNELYNIFPATSPDREKSTTAVSTIPRVPAMQALYQFIALATTLFIALTTGVLTGFLLKSGIFTRLKEKERYDDEVNWEVPPLTV
ncbi:hypothetical protein PYW08_011975 [Mythimna loreyi]|uniref:Uncharacterized protein n=1 Tax=Mythimna loreyi TaxID=667449 RepID=A0ACC2QMX0_9NEOP|nr:hypothetical protein PYW08_011975 [Mythimna loreyi]